MDVLWLDDGRDFTGYSLILPSVSIANIGQLAVDVLISALPTKQIAIVHHATLMPLAGSGAYEETNTGLTTAADLHVCYQSKILLLQIRTPHVRGQRRQFINALNQFISEVLPPNKGSNVWVLAGCEAANRRDAQLRGEPLRFFSAQPQDSPLFDKLRSVGPPVLEEFLNDRGEKEPFLPGAGYTKNLINTCSIPSVALLMFVDEGENTADAIKLASYCYACVSGPDSDVITNWKVPPSWKNMFGAPAPASLFL